MRKKSRYGKRRGGSFLTKKICIDFPENETDKTLFGTDAKTKRRINVSKKDLERIMKEGTKAKYHFFRRNFSSKKGLCLTPDEYDKALEIYNEVPIPHNQLKFENDERDFTIFQRNFTEKKKEIPTTFLPLTPHEIEQREKEKEKEINEKEKKEKEKQKQKQKEDLFQSELGKNIMFDAPIKHSLYGGRKRLQRQLNVKYRK